MSEGRLRDNPERRSLPKQGHPCQQEHKYRSKSAARHSYALPPRETHSKSRRTKGLGNGTVPNQLLAVGAKGGVPVTALSCSLRVFFHKGEGEGSNPGSGATRSAVGSARRTSRVCAGQIQSPADWASRIAFLAR